MARGPPIWSRRTRTYKTRPPRRASLKPAPETAVAAAPTPLTPSTTVEPDTGRPESVGRSSTGFDPRDRERRHSPDRSGRSPRPLSSRGSTRVHDRVWRTAGRTGRRDQTEAPGCPYRRVAGHGSGSRRRLVDRPHFGSKRDERIADRLIPSAARPAQRLGARDRRTAGPCPR